MPTLEVISLGATNVPDLSDLTVFVARGDTHLKSDRALFQDDLDALAGVIVHLGTRHKGTTVWSCGGEVSWNEARDGYFGFHSDALRDINLMLGRLWDVSPSRKLMFLSDIQGGPEEARRVTLSSNADFFKLAEAAMLRFNTIYTLHG
ncbi:hypothetical protein [Halocynthiibacter namhaensis]|uniref:hypothetical protein n=1 Tax=Halocynthiibacter namhaensis TaxID=1290553 RepID=UPI0005792982|nr:hypothetical protein [Halocynthiibacter namhaensis]